MNKFIAAVLVLAQVTTPLFASVYVLSEKTMLELSKKGAPQIDQIEAAFYQASFREGEVLKKYSPEIFGRSSYSDTNERAIIPFQPVFGPIFQAQIGVRKNFKQGIETSTYVVTDQRSASNPFIGQVNNATTTTLAFTTQVDLWKNLLGRMSQAELENSTLEKKRSDIEKEVQIKTFMISLRRVFWSLVANRESEIISTELFKTAEKQLIQAKLRLKNAVAEADEVARYEAQLASRKGTLLYLKYQKETFLKQLRNLLPELGDKNIELGDYDLSETLGEVFACTDVISKEKATPYEFTKYDEAVSLLQSMKSNNSALNARSSDADIKFFATVKSTGVGSEEVRSGNTRGSFGESLNDQTQQNRTGYETGINFTYPLGEVKESTKKVKELYDQKKLEASIKSIDAQVVSTHQELSKSILLLTDVIKAQRVSSEQLLKRLKLRQKKYEQARVSVDELVFDQDALLNSELMTVETQLQVLNTLFDYFVIYTDTPCSFNRI